MSFVPFSNLSAYLISDYSLNLIKDSQVSIHHVAKWIAISSLIFQNVINIRENVFRYDVKRRSRRRLRFRICLYSRFRNNGGTWLNFLKLGYSMPLLISDGILYFILLFNISPKEICIENFHTHYSFLFILLLLACIVKEFMPMYILKELLIQLKSQLFS